MPFWFKKKKPPEVETSKGGSVIYRHGGNEFLKPMLGFTDESTLGFIEAREAVYQRFFGDAKEVFHEMIPLIPHTDVYVYPPGHNGRDFFTLVTGGMSDLEMTIPQGVSSTASRVELIFYCSEPRKDYAELLRRLAHFPHDNKTWLGHGHTMPNGNPPAHILDSDVLDTLLFMPTIARPDSTLEEALQLDGKAVRFLWVVPLSTAECNFKLEKGIGAVFDLFEKKKHPLVFNPKRRSYI